MLESLGKVVGALAQFGEQPRILDGDDGLRGEIANDVDLLLIERQYFLAIDVDRADEFVLLEHRDGKHCAYAGKFHGRDHHRIARAVTGSGPYVLDLCSLFRSYHLAESGMRSRVDHSVQPGRGISRRRVVHRHGAKAVPFAKEQIAEFSTAKAYGLLQQRRKHRL